MGRSKRRFLFVLVAAAPVLACNAIIGISDFKRTECGADPCPINDEGGIDQLVPDNFVPDSGKDTGTDAPPGVGPVSWAAWQMPNHDKDAGILIGDPRPLKYNIIDNDQVEDDWTKLVWRRAVVGNAPGTDLFYSAARNECQKIPGGQPWRLPKRIELITLLSHGLGKPFINKTAFPGVFSDAVWTSSEVRPFVGKYWGVDFETGALVQLDGNDNADFAKVLCVKDKQ